MKQRIKLAQALVHDPKLLLLDEPTNGLDPAGREEMLALVERTGREFGIAVMVTSHLLGEIERVCDFAHRDRRRQAAVCRPGRARSRSRPAARPRARRRRSRSSPRASAREGWTSKRVGTELSVALSRRRDYDVVRDVAAELEAPLSANGDHASPARRAVPRDFADGAGHG